MKASTNSTSTTLFERTVRQSLVIPERVFLVDQAWSAIPDTGYQATITKLTKLADLPLKTLNGTNLNEEILIQEITRENTAFETKASNFNSLIRTMSRQKKGVIVIQNAHDLNKRMVGFLAKLITFTEQHNLRWKFLLFADLRVLNERALAVLTVDRRYPRVENPVSTNRQSSGFFEMLSSRMF